MSKYWTTKKVTNRFGNLLIRFSKNGLRANPNRAIYLKQCGDKYRVMIELDDANDVKLDTYKPHEVYCVDGTIYLSSILYHYDRAYKLLVRFRDQFYIDTTKW